MLPSWKRSQSPSDDDIHETFPPTWGVAEALRNRARPAAQSASSSVTQLSTAGDSSAPSNRAGVIYKAVSWVDVRTQPSPRIGPTSSLSATAPSTMDFDTWIESMAQAPQGAHSTESRLRASHDARLLLALRQIRQDQADQLHFLQNSRGLAYHLLRSPLVRHLSAAQSMDLQVLGTLEPILPNHDDWPEIAPAEGSDDEVVVVSDGYVDKATGAKRKRISNDI